MNGHNGPVTIEHIVSITTRYFGLHPDSIGDPGRQQCSVLARWIAALLIRRYVRKSTTDIGLILGRDHSTIVHGLQEIRKRLKTDEELRSDFETIECLLFLPESMSADVKERIYHIAIEKVARSAADHHTKMTYYRRGSFHYREMEIEFNRCMAALKETIWKLDNRGHSSMAEPLPSKQKTMGSIPTGRSITEQEVRAVAKAYRAAKIGIPVEDVGERHTADIGPMRKALKILELKGIEDG